MEPANILFVIAFIGLPIAFGIWALVSKRELKRISRARPPEHAANPEDAQEQPAPEQPAPQIIQEPQQPTVQIPAAQPSPQRTEPPPQQPAQPTVQMPAVEQAPPAGDPVQETVQLPAVEPDPPPSASEPEPDVEQPWDGSSGTTEEFRIFGYPEQPEDVPTPPVSQTPAPDPVAPARLSTGLPARRPFYPPRFAGKSRGVVKRLTPLERQRLIAPGSPRQYRS